MTRNDKQEESYYQNINLFVMCAQATTGSYSMPSIQNIYYKHQNLSSRWKLLRLTYIQFLSKIYSIFVKYDTYLRYQEITSINTPTVCDQTININMVNAHINIKTRKSCAYNIPAFTPYSTQYRARPSIQNVSQGYYLYINIVLLII